MTNRGTLDRRHGRQTDIGLRGLGLIAIAIAVLAIDALVGLQAAAGRTPLDGGTYALAAIGFAGGSFGGALLVLGHHLFDEVSVSRRWTPSVVALDVDPSPPRAALPDHHQEHTSDTVFAHA